MNVALIRTGNRLKEIYYEKDEQIKELQKEDIYKVNKYNIKKYYIKEKLSIGTGQIIKMNNQQVFINLNTKEIRANNDIFYNFELSNGTINFEYGDNIIVGLSIKIEFLSPNIIQVTNYFCNTKIDLLEITNLEEHYKDYPLYYSSPIYIKEQSTDEISLELPPEKEKKNKIGDLLKKLIPLAISLIIAILMLKIRPRGIRGILMLVSTLVSAAISVITIIEGRREAKAYNEHRNKVYKEYLSKKREELNLAKEHELSVYNHNNISQKNIISEINNNSSRLYEREYTDDSFLDLRIGIGEEGPNYKVKNPNEKLKLKKEDMELELEELYEDYKVISNVPYVINARKNNVGLVGNQDVILKQLNNILMQLLFSHSYHDLKMVYVLDERDYEDLNYYSYTKHSINEDTDMNNFVVNETTRDQILSSYTQILRQRDENKKKDVVFKPHLLFVITNYALIKNHPIMEFLLKDNEELNFSLIVIEKEANSLPKVINTVIEYKNTQEAHVLLSEGKVEDKKLNLEEFESSKVILEKTIRKIGQLEHIQGVKSSIPDKLTFLEMYDVKEVEDLRVKDRWKNNKSYNSLSVVVGKKSENDYVDLNLHEKAHGPHGLIAGTTGSGKSEVIQTYILSLAINYSPEEIGFLLIDYKGGGMANLFKDMPHHLGSITNLDGYQSLRALASIQSELKRRQKIFADTDVNHINGYHKLYEQGIVTEALPHLFLISDEFAELKAEQPEFMKELISAARIGRSLGVHLILATQKPSGVVDEQIWSNSKFKLSLKVAEEADSRELLKTIDAAYITNPGRGYLKVGNNELYELFQSGYSGAMYNKGLGSKFNKNIYEINKLGNRVLLSEAEEEYEEDVDEKTELSAVLEEITIQYENSDYQEVKKPWLEPLKDLIVAKKDIKDLKANISDLSVDYGLVDLPNSQDQIGLTHDFTKDGNLAIFGASGMGKSSTMLTIGMQLAQKNSPENLKYFIFDLGNSSLIHLKNLNHSAEYLKVEDEDIIKKTLKYLEKEIVIRKQLFEAQMVNNFAAYNKVSSKKQDAIIMFIDNIDAMKDMSKELVDYIVTIAREGASLGIYMIVSGLKTNSLKNSLLNVINQRVVLFTNDKSDITTLVGRSSYPQQEIAGRAQVKVEETEVAQLFYPIESTTEEDYISNMTQYVEEVNAQTSGVKNIGLKKMPQAHAYEVTPTTIDKVYLGKEYGEVEDFFIELQQTTLVQGDMKSGKTNVLKLIIEQLKKNHKVTILDDMMKNLYQYSQDDSVEYLTEIKDTMYKSDIFVINKLDFFNTLDRKEAKIVYENLYNEFLRGKHFIIEAFDGLKGSFELVKSFKKPLGVIWISDIDSQKFARVKDKDMKNEEKDKYDVFYIQGKEITKVKPPLVNTGNEDIKFEEEEILELEVGGAILENETMAIGGKNSLKVIEKLKQGYDSININYEEVDYSKLEDYKGRDGEIVLMMLELDKLNELSRDERIKTYDDLLELSKSNKIVVHLPSEPLKGVHDFIKMLKKPERAIISDNLGEQKFKMIRNREYKTKEVGNNEAYFVFDKVVKKIEL